MVCQASSINYYYFRKFIIWWLYYE